jgi:hypothetical protein
MGTRLLVVCLLLTLFSSQALSQAFDAKTWQAELEKTGEITPQITHALTQVGVVEKGGPNAGPEVESYLKVSGLGAGYAWCAAFVAWTLKQAQAVFPKTRSAVARHWQNKRSIDANHVLRTGMVVPSGYIVGWRNGNTPSGHLGLVLRWEGHTGYTVEGNTSSGVKGSQRDGDGVYIRKRHILPSNYFRITWFTPVDL